MTSFTFIHTADFQLGKGFHRFPSDASAILRRARLETVERIGRLATEASAGAVLVAGDCFDQVAVADETLRRFLAAAESFRGSWILLPGNHDPALAESPWSRLRRIGLPENVIVADRPEPIALGPAVVLPAPLRRRHDVQDLTAWFDGAATPASAFRIGLAHGCIPDFLPEGSEAMNPIARDRAERAGLDYLALGDWHGRLCVDTRTWYAGTPEPDSFRDNDSGSVLKVTLERPGAEPRVEPIPIGAIAWRRAALEVTPGGADEVDEHLRALATSKDAMIRLELTGVVDLTTREAVLEAVEAAGARLIDLDCDESALVLEPSDDDLDAIDAAGFVRNALQELREMLEGPDANRARRALAHLHRFHRETEGAC